MLETLKLRANLIESSCLIFVNCFLPCMIIVSFYACGLKWSICFLQSRRGSQGWQFLFLSHGVSHGVGKWTNQNKCRTKRCPRFVLFSCRRSMHDYCFLPCMIIVSFHAWLLFLSMRVASGDRFVSFKAGGDGRNGSFFFYRAGYRTGWTDRRTKTNVAPKDVYVNSVSSYEQYFSLTQTS